MSWLHGSPAAEKREKSARCGNLSAWVCRIFRQRQAGSRCAVEASRAALYVVGLWGIARRRRAIFGGAGGGPGQGPPDALARERQRVDARDDDFRAGNAKSIGLFQQGDRGGVGGIARRRRRR